MSGFKLFEIDQMLRDALDAADSAIDHETGNVPEDWAKFLEEVQMERDYKCLSVAAIIKEKLAEAEAIKSVIIPLTRRLLVCEIEAKRMKGFLQCVVEPGEPLKDSRASIGWRESSSVVVDDETRLPESCWKVERSIIKTEIKDLLKADKLDAGIAHIEKHNNIQVK